MEIPGLRATKSAIQSAMTDRSTGYAPVVQTSGPRYQLDSREMVRRGRYRELRRSIWIVLGLYAAQWPLREVIKSGWKPAGTYLGYHVPLAVPVRMSLVLDALLIMAYVLLAYRAYCAVRLERPGSPLVGWSVLGLWLVIAGAAVDVVEDAVLWHRARVDSPHDPLVVTVVGVSSTWVIGILVGVGLVVCVGSLLPIMVDRWRRHRWESDHDTDLEHEERLRAEQQDSTAQDVVICCSGGGIRSSAFSLGALQVLSETTVPGSSNSFYDRASAVIGVSGGGYVAAAFHTLRWKSGASAAQTPDAATAADAAAGMQAQLDTLPPFSESSPELQWLRRHSRYVLDSGRVAVDAALSLAFGVAVNLVLLFAVLGGTSWLLSWFFLASGRMAPEYDADMPRTLSAWYAGYQDDWSWAGRVWLVLLAGLLVFVLMKVADYVVTLPRSWRNTLLRTSTRVLAVGFAATLLLQGVPWLLEHLQRWATSSGSPLAELAYRLGLVPGSLCQQAVADPAHSAACGVKNVHDLGGVASRAWTTTGGFAAIVTSLLAVLGSIKGAEKEGGSSATSAFGKLAGRAWARVKGTLVPWTATVVIVLVLVVLLLRWVVGLTGSGVHHDGVPHLDLWTHVTVVALLLIGIRLLTEPNRTSLHHFFRERISYAFLLRRTVEGGVEPLPYGEPLRYSHSGEVDGPALVTCAVANVTDEELVPSRRGCTPFVFDQHQIGLTDGLIPDVAGRRASAVYEFAADYRYRDATVPAAVAMSAAAFSPLAGRENVHLGPYRAALALANARLGVWLPNPLWVDEVHLARRLLRLRRIDEADHLTRRMKPEDRNRLNVATTVWGQPKKGAFDVAVAATVLLASDDDELSSTRARLVAACAATGRDDWRDRVTGAEPGADLHQAADSVRAEALGIGAPAGPGSSGRGSSGRGSSGRGSSGRGSSGRGDPGLGWHVAEFLEGFITKPGITRVVKEAMGKASVYDRFLYITDGGHYDNLGLVEALRRRPAEIFVIDASNDKVDTFRTIGRAIATAQMDLDCDVRLDPRPMVTTKKGTQVAWCTGKAYFGDGAPDEFTWIHVVKALLIEDLPWDVETYAADNPDFPRTSTNNQLYGEFDLEAYRVLGRRAMEGLLAARTAVPPSQGSAD